MGRALLGTCGRVLQYVLHVTVHVVKSYVTSKCHQYLFEMHMNVTHEKFPIGSHQKTCEISEMQMHNYTIAVVSRTIPYKNIAAN